MRGIGSDVYIHVQDQPPPDCSQPPTLLAICPETPLPSLPLQHTLCQLTSTGLIWWHHGSDAATVGPFMTALLLKNGG